MKIKTRRAILIAGTLFLVSAALSAAFFGWLQNAAFSDPDPSALWSWSLQSKQAVKSGAAGAVIMTLYEPYALARNLVVILFALVGTAWAAFRLMGLFSRDRTPTNERLAQELSSTRLHLDAELVNILVNFRSHFEKNSRFAAALARGQTSLEKPQNQEQLRTAIQLLITENRLMMKSNEEYKQKLEESRAQIETLRADLSKSLELSVRDSLTSAYTRRHFDETLVKEIQEARNSASALSLIIADIDNFKKINDTFGHQIGDEVLKNFADLMIENTKGGDCVARYGGEEFAIILPSTPAEAAASLAEQIRKKLEMKKWIAKGVRPVGTVTASFGISQLRDDEGAEGMINRADSKLYESKAAGRNRVSK